MCLAAAVEVRIGDVGYVWEGSFCTLFNATLPKTHPINRKGVPEGFIPLDFNTAELVRTRDGYLPDAPVCSQTVRRLSAVAQAGATSPLVPVGAQTHLSFECARSKGGLVVLNGGGAIQEVLRPNKAFPEYMHTYHDSWCDFAREKGHDVSPEDIVMVRGTVKASEWTVAAFMDETRHQSLELEAQGGLIGSAGISLSLSVASSMSVEHRSGRSQPRISSDEEDSAANFRPMRNQCMFLCRYKMRYRKWPWQIKKIKAEGYRDDEPSSDSDSEEDTSAESDSEDEDVIEDDCSLTKVLDPLDTLMDYILENSGCDVAIVSDEDVWGLQNLGYITTASQFAEQLRTSRPSVCVSADGSESYYQLH
ncbi:hypothetical protein BDY19DRAFT_140693 [Irpex rosettiformis]|uniref:Uncharacterized protein n=1 Tax=Irpex rosettiformis TaxID=378272 RepID=A0ACB8U4U2_9APHY|nr:hypothetical protein BDY19DRAFT_140693 [Irpex rosettiformis]